MRKQMNGFWILQEGWGEPLNGFCIGQLMRFYLLLCVQWCCAVFNGVAVPPLWTANELPRL